MIASFDARVVRRIYSLLALTLFTFALVGARAQGGDGHDSDRTTSLLVKLRSGITLNYVVQGDANGPAIVLIQVRATRGTRGSAYCRCCLRATAYTL